MRFRLHFQDPLRHCSFKFHSAHVPMPLQPPAPFPHSPTPSPPVPPPPPLPQALIFRGIALQQLPLGAGTVKSLTGDLLTCHGVTARPETAVDWAALETEKY